jgi:hypothetical protein
MSKSQGQYIVDEKGRKTAVIIPVQSLPSAGMSLL